MSAYKIYLNSERWKAKRFKVLIRDGGICQFWCRQKATQVHHLTYARIFNEKLDDLISICNRCHEDIHKLNKLELKSVNKLVMYNLMCEKYNLPKKKPEENEAWGKLAALRLPITS